MTPQGRKEISRRQQQEASPGSYESLSRRVAYLEAELEATKRRLWDLEQQVWGRR